MNMPGFTALASFHETMDAYAMSRAEIWNTPVSAQAASSVELSFNPTCGPCVCRVLDSGTTRFFICNRTCWFLFTPGPGLPPQRIFYTVPCTRWD
jgi:hypothetical protein